MKRNYKGENFPDNIQRTTVAVIQKCKALLSNSKSYSIWDIYALHRTRVVFNPSFLKRVPTVPTDKKSDIKGLYILSKVNGKPFYVGISQTILRRLKQHFFSPYLNQSSLVYLMSHQRFERRNGKPFDGLRKDFPFRKYSPEIQKELQDTTRITIVPIADSFELYLSEIMYSCYFKTYWNSFETH